MDPTLDQKYDLLDCVICNKPLDPNIYVVYINKKVSQSVLDPLFYHVECLDSWADKRLIRTISTRQLRHLGSNDHEMDDIEKHIDKEVKLTNYHLVMEGEYVADFNFNGDGKQTFSEQVKQLVPGRCDHCKIMCCRFILCYLLFACFVSLIVLAIYLSFYVMN